MTRYTLALFFLALVHQPWTCADELAASSSVAPVPDLVKQEPQLAPVEEIKPTDKPPVSSSVPSSRRLIGGVEEQDLAILWDGWHNKLAKVVGKTVFPNPIYSLNIPNGLMTRYRCVVSSDKHIKKAEIVQSSGLLFFDKLVLDAVWRLDGRELLAFPAGSKRTEVSTTMMLKVGPKTPGRDVEVFNDFEYSEFGPDQR